jgi:hypothetical protein
MVKPGISKRRSLRFSSDEKFKNRRDAWIYSVFERCFIRFTRGKHGEIIIWLNTSRATILLCLISIVGLILVDHTSSKVDLQFYPNMSIF